MNKIVIIFSLLFFSKLSAQSQEDRFKMVIVEPKFADEVNSLGYAISHDERFSKIFIIESKTSDSIQSPIIEIYAPDGFRMGTCFMVGFSRPLDLTYYQQIEKNNRDRWDRLRVLPSYNLHKEQKIKG